MRVGLVYLFDTESTAKAQSYNDKGETTIANLFDVDKGEDGAIDVQEMHLTTTPVALAIEFTSSSDAKEIDALVRQNITDDQQYEAIGFVPTAGAYPETLIMTVKPRR